MIPYLFDVWTAVHFMGWGLAAIITLRNHPLRTVFLAALIAGVSWEVFESWVIEPWLGFHEPWWNRWISDLVADTSGAVVGVWLISCRRGLRRVRDRLNR